MDREDYRKRVKAEVVKLLEVRYEPLGDGYTPIMRDTSVDEVVESILDIYEVRDEKISQTLS